MRLMIQWRAPEPIRERTTSKARVRASKKTRSPEVIAAQFLAEGDDAPLLLPSWARESLDATSWTGQAFQVAKLSSAADRLATEFDANDRNVTRIILENAALDVDLTLPIVVWATQRQLVEELEGQIVIGGTD